MKIRTAEKQDVKRLVEIYSYYVENTDITFEYETPSEEEFEGRIQKILEKYPYLVAEKDGQILGYAYAAPFKTRAAYDWAVETTVYVDQKCHEKGVGTALYEELERLLKEQNIRNLNACITWPNIPSQNFHKKRGFETVAHFHKCGFKFGRWIDMIWMEKMIGEHQGDPGPVIWRKQ